MIPFPNKKYSVIYADPPWSYQDKRCNGNAADHYPTMCIEDICSLPVHDIEVNKYNIESTDGFAHTENGERI